MLLLSIRMRTLRLSVLSASAPNIAASNDNQTWCKWRNTYSIIASTSTILHWRKVEKRRSDRLIRMIKEQFFLSKIYVHAAPVKLYEDTPLVGLVRSLVPPSAPNIAASRLTMLLNWYFAIDWSSKPIVGLNFVVSWSSDLSEFLVAWSSNPFNFIMACSSNPSEFFSPSQSIFSCNTTENGARL